jgi:4-amino-4-deoxy-L-arabinose transferase-like glycosyltransferase
VFVAAVLFHVLGTWNLPLIDRDEPRFAEASREMRERNDYIVPYFNNDYRFDKPPLTYWAQVASYRLFDENDFAARFPSAIAASLTSLVIFAWGSRIVAPIVGFRAAVIFTLSLQTFIHAKAAVADMWLVLFMTIAFWAGFEWLGTGKTLNAQRSTSNAQLAGDAGSIGLWWSVFYVALAFAFLSKGPIGWIPIIPVAWLMIRHGRFGAMGWVTFIGGILLMFGIICLWAVPALIQTHGEFWRVGIGRHVIGRSIGAMEGHGAKSFGLYLLLLPFYFVFVFVSFFPWSVKLPRLFKELKRERDALDGYFLCGILSIFGIFTLVATKLPHYTLPALPLLSLLLARRWPEQASTTKSVFSFGRIAVATATLWIVIALILPPLVAPYFPSYALYLKSRDYLKPEMEFGSAEFGEPSLVWYFRSRVKTFLTPLTKKNVDAFMAKPGPRLVIVPTAMVQDLSLQNAPVRRFFPTHGFNIPKGSPVDLTLILKPD